jgi:hypothetical protein
MKEEIRCTMEWRVGVIRSKKDYDKLEGPV